MIMSAHQPAYNPWLGYFDKIKRSDIFIFLDTVQYEKNSFTNRNLIKTSNGSVWITVPVIKTNHFDMTMKDMKIDNRSNWRKKHLNAIYLAYKKAPYFDEIYPRLEKLYAIDYEYLVDMTFEHLEFWLKILNINTKIMKSSELNVFSQKSDFVFDLCKSVDADMYISGALGKNYLELDKFKNAGIKVEFQDYHTPIYNQLYGDFVPNLGIIDYVMNVNEYDF